MADQVVLLSKPQQRREDKSMSKVLLIVLLGGVLIVIGNLLSLLTIGEESMKAEDSDLQQIVLRIEGSPRTEFFGVCLVGDKEKTINGVVPQRYTYNLPNNQKLGCEIHKTRKDAGTLKAILLNGNGNRSTQQTDAPRGSIKLTLSSSSSTNQRNSSSSSVVSSSGSSSVSSSSSSTSSR